MHSSRADDPILHTSVVVAGKDQVSSNLADEAVILSLKSGVYYGLNSVGARIWNLIQQPQVVQDVCDAIVNEYDVEPDRCEYDLFEVLATLYAEGLLEVRGQTSS